MTKTLTALLAAALILALLPTTQALAGEPPISMPNAQRATGNYVDALCGPAAKRSCSSYAVAPAEFCGRHGTIVECDFALWYRADKRQCDGRVIVQRVAGHLTVRLKDASTWTKARHCHATYSF